jgi:hypothetical protein
VRDLTISDRVKGTANAHQCLEPANERPWHVTRDEQQEDLPAITCNGLCCKDRAGWWGAFRGGEGVREARAPSRASAGPWRGGLGARGRDGQRQRACRSPLMMEERGARVEFWFGVGGGSAAPRGKNQNIKPFSGKILNL